MKSTMLLLDPRPELSTMVDMVEHAFAMSEASNMPAMMELRIRACHVRGSLISKDNRTPVVSSLSPLAEPASFNYERLAHPPATFRHEKRKIDERLPAAREYIVKHGLNEHHDGKHADIGIIIQGGLTNALLRSLQQFGLADVFGTSDVPLLILNVTYPLVHEQIADFARDKRAVLVIEEGSPDYIEQEIATLLRRRDLQTALHGKDILPATGEVTPEVMMRGLLRFFAKHFSNADTRNAQAMLEATDTRRTRIAAQLDKALPARPPGFCIGCPERPVFSALKLAQQDSEYPMAVQLHGGSLASARIRPWAASCSGSSIPVPTSPRTTRAGPRNGETSCAVAARLGSHSPSSPTRTQPQTWPWCGTSTRRPQASKAATACQFAAASASRRSVTPMASHLAAAHGHTACASSASDMPRTMASVTGCSASTLGACSMPARSGPPISLTALSG
jgi:hypothetical protein